MTSRTLSRVIGAVLSCAALSAGPAFAADEELETTGAVSIGAQTLNADGDEENLERYGDGLQDELVIPSITVEAGKGANWFSLEGRDIGQKDQSLDVEGGIYGKLKVTAGWNQQFRNYSDGTFIGSRTAPGYWAVPDAVQSTLATGFTPLNVAPTAGGQAALLDVLASSPEVPLEQQRKTATGAVEYTVMKGLTLRAGLSREDRTGLRTVGSGSYRRSATGATAIGGLGESFRVYGQEFPMPVDYETTGYDLGLDFVHGRYSGDFTFRQTKFENNIDSVAYENPLLLVGQSNQVGGAPLHRMVLSPDYDSQAFDVSFAISDLPLGSRLTASYGSDKVEQDESFFPLTANTAVLDDSGVVAASLTPPGANLDGDVTTTSINLVLSSRPMQDLGVNVRYNSYDYDNKSAVLTWTGWVGIGESTWKDYDGSIAAQQPYRNRVPEYKRDRMSIDANYSFASWLRLKGEYLNEKYDRNSDRYADNDEDTFRVTLQAMPVDWASMRFVYKASKRDIDGDYAAHLHNGVQEEWEELRMFDMAERDRDGYEVHIDLDPTDTLSFGLSWQETEDTYDEEFYGLHEAKGDALSLDASYRPNERLTLFAYYNQDSLESAQLNRTKSDQFGGGAFAVPQNDFQTNMKDDNDTYGLDLEFAIIPERLKATLSFDRSTGKTDIVTTNPDYLAGTTVTGATAYPWPQVDVESTEFQFELAYVWSAKLSTALSYLYLKQDIHDFASDLTSQYSNVADIQGNVPSHYVFMDAHPGSYKSNSILVTVHYQF